MHLQRLAGAETHRIIDPQTHFISGHIGVQVDGRGDLGGGAQRIEHHPPGIGPGGDVVQIERVRGLQGDVVARRIGEGLRQPHGEIAAIGVGEGRTVPGGHFAHRQGANVLNGDIARPRVFGAEGGGLSQQVNAADRRDVDIARAQGGEAIALHRCALQAQLRPRLQGSLNKVQRAARAQGHLLHPRAVSEPAKEAGDLRIAAGGEVHGKGRAQFDLGRIQRLHVHDDFAGGDGVKARGQIRRIHRRLAIRSPRLGVVEAGGFVVVDALSAAIGIDAHGGNRIIGGGGDGATAASGDLQLLDRRAAHPLHHAVDVDIGVGGEAHQGGRAERPIHFEGFAGLQNQGVGGQIQGLAVGHAQMHGVGRAQLQGSGGLIALLHGEIIACAQMQIGAKRQGVAAHQILHRQVAAGGGERQRAVDPARRDLQHLHVAIGLQGHRPGISGNMRCRHTGARLAVAVQIAQLDIAAGRCNRDPGVDRRVQAADGSVCGEGEPITDEVGLGVIDSADGAACGQADVAFRRERARLARIGGEDPRLHAAHADGPGGSDHHIQIVAAGEQGDRLQRHIAVVGQAEGAFTHIGLMHGEGSAAAVAHRHIPRHPRSQGQGAGVGGEGQGGVGAHGDVVGAQGAVAAGDNGAVGVQGQIAQPGHGDRIIQNVAAMGGEPHAAGVGSAKGLGVGHAQLAHHVHADDAVGGDRVGQDQIRRAGNGDIARAAGFGVHAAARQIGAHAAHRPRGERISADLTQGVIDGSGITGERNGGPGHIDLIQPHIARTVQGEALGLQITLAQGDGSAVDSQGSARIGDLQVAGQVAGDRAHGVHSEALSGVDGAIQRQRAACVQIDALQAGERPGHAQIAARSEGNGAGGADAAIINRDSGRIGDGDGAHGAEADRRVRRNGGDRGDGAGVAGHPQPLLGDGAARIHAEGADVDQRAEIGVAAALNGDRAARDKGFAIEFGKRTGRIIAVLAHRLQRSLLRGDGRGDPLGHLLAGDHLGLHFAGLVDRLGSPDGFGVAAPVVSEGQARIGDVAPHRGPVVVVVVLGFVDVLIGAVPTRIPLHRIAA
ncbi:hypothetical protein MAIT1_03633 [Magnetofaba australis IT-1]|uniref:Uncharacterized protein n=1 Tax=Magnetofaba australis IT-1 TaxID=1434232 RepID=A0A1Y2K6N8_9PROT|nr:hypothetical protein MAIT1_03633 [Magnetofaba australis IT-1]